MQDNKKWVESIQMNIEGIAPLYIIVPVLMLQQKFIGDKPLGGNSKPMH